MYLRSFASFLRESVTSKNYYKYKVKELKKSSEATIVKCELINSGDIVMMNLYDIINNKLHFFSPDDVVMLIKSIDKEDTEKTFNKKSSYTHTITIAFTILLILSNLGAVKIFDFMGHKLAAGIVFFPFLYILSDILAEVYGFSESRKVIWTAFFYNILFNISLYIIILLPSSGQENVQAAFEQLFYMSPRIVVASMLSYLVGEFFNTSILTVLKIKFAGRFFMVRAVFSTFIAAFIETMIFSVIAFAGKISVGELLNMMIILSVFKVSYEIILMPLTVRFVWFLKNKEGINSFEKPSIEKILPSF